MGRSLLGTTGIRRALAATAAVAIVVAAASLAWHAGSSSKAHVSAERLYMRMVSTDDPPWAVPASRAAARTIVDRHPDSQWVSEAWRVVALDAESRGNTAEALDAWAAYTEVFAGAPVPGTAYGHHRRAQLEESIGRRGAAEERYRRAYHAIMHGDSDMQMWLALDAARSIARLKRYEGLWAEASGWELRAMSLAR